MSRRFAFFVIALLAAVTAGDRLAGSPHQIALVNGNGSFRFYADELPDGSHTYESDYLPECWWFLTPQHESGSLATSDWQRLKSLSCCESLPPMDETQLDAPADPWGVLQRDGEIVEIRYAEWRQLGSTQVADSFYSMAFKAKNGP